MEETSSIIVPPYSITDSQIISSSVNQLFLSSSIAVEESSSIIVPPYSITDSQIISSTVNQLLLSSSIVVQSSQMSPYHSTMDSGLVSFSSSLFSSSNIQTRSSTPSSMYSPISLALSSIDSLSSIIPTLTSPSKYDCTVLSCIFIRAINLLFLLFFIQVYIQTSVSVTPSTSYVNLTCEMTENWVETMAGENATSIGGCYSGAANGMYSLLFSVIIIIINLLLLLCTYQLFVFATAVEDGKR